MNFPQATVLIFTIITLTFFGTLSVVDGQNKQERELLNAQMQGIEIELKEQWKTLKYESKKELKTCKLMVEVSPKKENDYDRSLQEFVLDSSFCETMPIKGQQTFMQPNSVFFEIQKTGCSDNFEDEEKYPLSDCL